MFLFGSAWIGQVVFFSFPSSCDCLNGTVFGKKQQLGDPGVNFALACSFIAKETSTHLPQTVPIWMCPQLRFYAYASKGSAQAAETNAALRSGHVVARRRLEILRPELPENAVSFQA